MPTTAEKITALLAEDATGARIPCAEFLKVTWDTGVINYYASAAFHEMPPFTGIGHVIEPRLIPQNKKDPFHELELNPDLRTENISITFEDIDKTITTLFQTYSSGVKAEIVLYYPSQDLTISVFFGQLQAPSVYGWKTLKATLTNGYRSRELIIPGRIRPRDCTAHVFGGLLPDADAVRSSLCPSDRHVGGIVGLLNPVTGLPFIDCPKTLEGCIARFGHGNFFGGFNTNASAVQVGQHNYNLAISKGNASNLKEPIRVIFGFPHVKQSQLLLFAREGSTSPNDFVRTLWELGEGPIRGLTNMFINETAQTNPNHINLRDGTRGQGRTGYSSDVSNFSSTAVLFINYGRVVPNNVNANNISLSAKIDGFREVCVYTDAVTKTRIWTDDRIWCLLEMYRNQKFGLGYAESEFTIADWITASTHGIAQVSHTYTYPDGETGTLVSRRTSFNAVMEGRAVSEQIEDICRSGAVSIPFQHEGKFTIASFRKATAPELAAAKVFTDTGQNVNIIWDGGQPMIELSQTPDNKVVNEIELRFEEAANNGTERPLFVDNRNQKKKAGRQLGPGYSLTVPKRFVGFGGTGYAENLRLAYRLLKYGEFDEGGTDNNLRATITVPFEHVLGIKRYEIIRIVSELLDPFTIAESGEAVSETPQYFRILRMKKVSGGRCQITAQVYNHTSYSAFEVASDGTGGGGGGNGDRCAVSEAGSFVVNGIYEYYGVVNTRPAYRKGPYQITWSGEWYLRLGDGPVLYLSLDDVAYPWLGVWATVNGEDPAPSVDIGSPPLPRPADLILGAPTYDAATGILSVPIGL